MDEFAGLIKREFEMIASEEEKNLVDFETGMTEEEMAAIKNRCLESIKKRIRLYQEGKVDCCI